jgi:eukaryotic-like serine/threonine-protein kinase
MTARQFGRFRLLEDLGRGGMAVISRAVVDGPRGFQRELVVKRIQPALAQPRFVNLLATEARLSARLHHPGIVQVYEFGDVDGEYYLAMELVEGLDLRHVRRAWARREQRPPVGVVCHIVREVASALAYAHALTDSDGRPLQIVHRDVSPSNIMITPLGTVKLLDFGIAKAADHIRCDQTPTDVGWLRGKISYLSPEQAAGWPLDGRTDIFSLGIVFYELLTMERLFPSTPAFQTIRRIREVDVPPPRTLVPELPADVEAVVMKMLARAPDHRFANCDELVTALTPITRRLDGDAAALRRCYVELGTVARAHAKTRPPARLHDDVEDATEPTVTTPMPTRREPIQNPFQH